MLIRPPTLLFAFLLSLLLHGTLFSPTLGDVVASFFSQKSKREPFVRKLPLEASLVPKEPLFKREALLKNTLETAEKKEPSQAKPEVRKRGTDQRRATKDIQKALAHYVFYPEIAKTNGWQGDVHLYVVLDEAGRVLEVRLLETSGYAVLDNAAIKGFYAIGVLPGVSAAWVYQFRLSP